jgi:glutaredoxin
MKIKISREMIVLTLVASILLGYIMFKVTKQMKPNKERHSKCSQKLKFYGRDSCPYCLKMKTQMKKDGTYSMCTFIDTSTEEGKSEFKVTCSQKNHKGSVPYFWNTCNDKTAVGFMSKSDLFSKLGL